jgi:ribonuclease HII
MERALLRAGALRVAGVDEVGRGALAGPVSVGVVVVDAATRTAPRGLRDSKLLTPAAREALCGPVRRWCTASAVGHASPAEIDAWGIIAALRAAAHRALGELAAAGHAPDVVILDGAHDWLSPPAQGELFGPDVPAAAAPAVHTRVKADVTCAVVAAASVLAKCERDALLTALGAEHPGYRWVENKGYAVPEHLAALRALGPSPHHRVSWRLPCEATGPEDVGEEAALVAAPSGVPVDADPVAAGAARHAAGQAREAPREVALAGGMMEP